MEIYIIFPLKPIYQLLICCLSSECTLQCMLSNNGAPLSNTPLKSEQCCSVRAMGDMVEGKVYRVGSRVGSLDVRLLVEPPPAVVPLLPCSLSLPVLHTEARVAVQLIGCEACASCVHWTPIPCPACHM